MKKQLIPMRRIKIPSKTIKEMFCRQLKFQSRFHDMNKIIDGSKLMNVETQSYIDLMLTCIIQEACEARDWTNFKPWKTYPKKWSLKKRREYLNEIIDIQHFVINACIAVGCDEKEFIKLFFNKQKENVIRQKVGY